MDNEHASDIIVIIPLLSPWQMFKSLNFEWHFQFFQCYSHGCVAMWTFST